MQLEQVIYVTWSSVIIIIGTIGNSLTLLAIPYAARRNKFNLKSNWPTTVFILNLALADLLYCLINLPLLALQKSGHDWNLGLTFCKIIANIRYSNAYADWMSLAMIALSRCCCVTNPGKVTIFASRKARISILIGIRIYALALLIPTNLNILGEFGIRSTSADTVSVGKCYLKSGENGFPPSTILYTTAFTIPAIIIILSYGRIWFYMWQNNKMIKSQGSKHVTKILEKNEFKITWTLFLICLCYFLMVMPRLITSNLDALGLYHHHDWLSPILYCLYWTHYAINFFIYAAVNERFRLAYLYFLKEMKIKFCIHLPFRNESSQVYYIDVNQL